MVNEGGKSREGGERTKEVLYKGWGRAFSKKTSLNHEARAIGVQKEPERRKRKYLRGNGEHHIHLKTRFSSPDARQQ